MGINCVVALFGWLGALNNPRVFPPRRSVLSIRSAPRLLSHFRVSCCPAMPGACSRASTASPRRCAQRRHTTAPRRPGQCTRTFICRRAARSGGRRRPATVWLGAGAGMGGLGAARLERGAFARRGQRRRRQTRRPQEQAVAAAAAAAAGAHLAPGRPARLGRRRSSAAFPWRGRGAGRPDAVCQ